MWFIFGDTMVIDGNPPHYWVEQRRLRHLAYAQKFICFCILLQAFTCVRGQVLPTASPNLFNTISGPSITHLRPTSSGYHNIFGTCPSHQPAGELQIDGSGNGFNRDYDCATHAVTKELLYTSWIVNGPAYWSDIHSNGFRVSAQYQNGQITSITFHSCAGPLTISLPNGTGNWKVPDYSDCKTNPSGIYETGQLKNWLKEGRWYAVNWGNPKGKVYELNYIDGALDGVAHWFYGGDPTATVTFAHGTPNGPFTWISGNLEVQGENKDGDGTAVLAGFPSNPSGPAPAGKAWGTWKFYNKGLMIGENILSNGSGHFKNWSADGTLNTEGDVKNGLQDGDWIVYDYSETPTTIYSFKDGKYLGSKPYQKTATSSK
jgi:antitoxin component YwqK of YwqJK toxin-antitoxin module